CASRDRRLTSAQPVTTQGIAVPLSGPTFPAPRMSPRSGTTGRACSSRRNSTLGRRPPSSCCAPNPCSRKRGPRRHPNNRVMWSTPPVTALRSVGCELLAGQLLGDGPQAVGLFGMLQGAVELLLADAAAEVAGPARTV